MIQYVIPYVFAFVPLIISTSCGSGTKKAGVAQDPYHYEITKRVIAKNGIVVCAHPLAAKVGVEILKKGGNAFDAAIATQLALAVVYPGAGNIGGGGFLVAQKAKGEALALDYREMAPGQARREMYLDSAGNIRPGESVNGHRSSGVPGTVAGLFETLKYAKLPIADLIQPAIELARNGFAITEREARSLNALQQEFSTYNTRPTAFQKNSKWEVNDTLLQPELANTLERIRDKGVKGFYEGETAALIVEEMKRGKGIITTEDLKNYKAEWREPHLFTYHGHQLVTMPLPSSGGLLLNQMLKMVEYRKLKDYGFLSGTAVQLMTEAERRAYSDRAMYMGDPDFYKAPVDKMVDSIYLEKRMKDFVAGKAGKSIEIPKGENLWKESKETTHLSVLDAEGNAVAVTTTLNNGYGSRTVVGGAGFLMNDEMDDFSSKPGAPNIYGAVGGEANAIVPKKRMLSSMCPTIVLKDNKPFLVLGTPGGTTIPTSVFQTIVDLLDFNLSVSDAVNLPKFHHQWLPDNIMIEKSFPDSTRQLLTGMGYALEEIKEIGRTEVIRLDNGNMEGVGDNRGDDSAEGY